MRKQQTALWYLVHDRGCRIDSDDDLDRLLVRALELWEGAPNPPVVAYEGMVLELAPAPGVSAQDPT